MFKKMRLKFSKDGASKFISHLDLMHVFQRSFARAGIEVWQTEGFNRHAYVSIALPMPVGMSARGEFLDFRVEEDIEPDFIERLNSALPTGLEVTEVYEEGAPVKEIAYADYVMTGECDADTFEKIREMLKDRDLELIKKSKSGERTVRFYDFVRGEPEVAYENGEVKIEMTLGAGENNLSSTAVAKHIKNTIGFKGNFIHVRERILDKNGAEFR